MPQWDEATLTERQRKWFAAVRAGLERDTGRSLEQWAEIARTCPEAGHRARLKWLKDHHGLGQNHASQVLSAAFPSGPPQDEDALWADPGARAVFEAVRAAALALPEVLEGRRKAYTAFSRRVQFAAIRPDKAGGAVLGLAVTPDAGARLTAPGRESWSERLGAVLGLDTPAQVDAQVAAWLRQAWERS